MNITDMKTVIQQLWPDNYRQKLSQRIEVLLLEVLESNDVDTFTQFYNYHGPSFLLPTSRFDHTPFSDLVKYPLFVKTWLVGRSQRDIMVGMATTDLRTSPVIKQRLNVLK
jgi:hypothetical protein